MSASSTLSTADKGAVHTQGAAKLSTTSTKADKPRVPDANAPGATWNVRDPSNDWLLKDTHHLLWPNGPDGPWSVSLTTGLDERCKTMFECAQEDWKKAIASGDVAKYQKFLKSMSLTVSDNPLEATALDHGFIPESDGIAAVDLEKRLMSTLPHIAYRHRQPIDRAESMLSRCDAATRSYWLRDWQSDLDSLRSTSTALKKMSRECNLWPT